MRESFQMPDEDAKRSFAEPDIELDELARKVIGAAIEVHRRLGPGLDESLYQAAMQVELRFMQIPFAQQVVVPVQYRGEQIGIRRIDLIVDGRLVVELKAIE